MPFIISRTSRSISREQEQQLKTRLGKAIELVPGKSEQYLMLGFEDNCRFCFRESMKLGCKGNCCSFIYPRCTIGMTRNLHTIRVVFGAITLCRWSQHLVKQHNF